VTPLDLKPTRMGVDLLAEKRCSNEGVSLRAGVGRSDIEARLRAFLHSVERDRLESPKQPHEEKVGGERDEGITSGKL